MTPEVEEATKAVILAALNAGVSPETVSLAFGFNDQVEFQAFAPKGMVN